MPLHDGSLCVLATQFYSISMLSRVLSGTKNDTSFVVLIYHHFHLLIIFKNPKAREFFLNEMKNKKYIYIYKLLIKRPMQVL